MHEGLVCRVRPDGGHTIVMPDDAELRRRLLRDHHE